MFIYIASIPVWDFWDNQDHSATEFSYGTALVAVGGVSIIGSGILDLPARGSMNISSTRVWNFF